MNARVLVSREELQIILQGAARVSHVNFVSTTILILISCPSKGVLYCLETCKMCHSSGNEYSESVGIEVHQNQN
jgi:hypothetical protein